MLVGYALDYMHAGDTLVISKLDRLWCVPINRIPACGDF